MVWWKQHESQFLHFWIADHLLYNKSWDLTDLPAGFRACGNGFQVILHLFIFILFRFIFRFISQVYEGKWNFQQVVTWSLWHFSVFCYTLTQVWGVALWGKAFQNNVLCKKNSFWHLDRHCEDIAKLEGMNTFLFDPLKNTSRPPSHFRPVIQLYLACKNLLHWSIVINGLAIYNIKRIVESENRAFQNWWGAYHMYCILTLPINLYVLFVELMWLIK